MTLKLPEEKSLREIRLTFDTDLSHEIMPSIVREVRERQVKGMPHELVKDYRISLYSQGKKVWEKTILDNVQRLNIHPLEDIKCGQVEVTVLETHGLERARIYEVRIY